MAKADLTDCVNPRIIADAGQIGRDFVGNEPFAHVVLDDFLRASFADELVEEFPAFDRGNSIGDDGRKGDKATFTRVTQLGSAYVALDDLIKSPAFLTMLGQLTRIPELLYDPFYLGGGTHENREGASLDPHIDFNFHPSERWHRRLNLLLYLNPEWDVEWGGCLELFRNPRVDPVAMKSILPRFNRCVIFDTSEHSWHGFSRIRLPANRHAVTRKSIALYFYTADRPAEEAAPRHSTVYVQRQLPPHLDAGHMLTQADIQELRILLASRDGHIQTLQAENTRLLQAQDRGLPGQILYLMKRAYVRFRR